MVEVRKVFLVRIDGIVLRKIREVKNCRGIEIGSVNGVRKGDSVNK